MTTFYNINRLGLSGNGQLSIPFSGKSGQVTGELTGNPEINTTQWVYTLFCPR